MVELVALQLTGLAEHRGTRETAVSSISKRESGMLCTSCLSCVEQRRSSSYLSRTNGGEKRITYSCLETAGVFVRTERSRKCKHKTSHCGTPWWRCPLWTTSNNNIRSTSVFIYTWHACDLSDCIYLDLCYDRIVVLCVYACKHILISETGISPYPSFEKPDFATLRVRDLRLYFPTVQGFFSKLGPVFQHF